MPDIKVVFWNIQDFGSGAEPNQGNFVPLCNFIAEVVRNTEADILMVMELRLRGVGFLPTLQEALCSLDAPNNNWYYDWIKGTLKNTRDPATPPPFETNRHLGWTQRSHSEGYAMFWNQNIAKFTMQTAAPITDPRMPVNGGVGTVPCTHSSLVKCPRIPIGGGPATYGTPFLPPAGIPGGTPAAGITVPAGPGNYLLPGGATFPPGFTPPVGLPNLNAGFTLPANTRIGAGGLRLNLPLRSHPIVIPENYVLPNPFTLPPANTCLVPSHSLSLVVIGRAGGNTPADIHTAASTKEKVQGAYIPPIPVRSIFGNRIREISAQNFNPGAANAWTFLPFVANNRGVSFYQHSSARRPAFCTIRVNDGLGSLIPIAVYHAPSKDKVAKDGANLAAFSHCLYKTYDWSRIPAGTPPNATGWIDTTKAVIGGDWNIRLPNYGGPNANLHPYNKFTDAYNAPGPMADNISGGANFTTGGNIGIRVFEGPPAAHPAHPPPPAPSPHAILPPLPITPSRADNPLNKSTVQLRHPIVPPRGRRRGRRRLPAPPSYYVISNDTDHYRRSAIDNIFYKGFTVAQTPRHRFRIRQHPGGPYLQVDADLYDLVKALRQYIPIPGAAPGAARDPNDNFFIYPPIIRAFGGLPFARPLPHSILEETQFLADIGIGHFAGNINPPVPMPYVYAPMKLLVYPGGISGIPPDPTIFVAPPHIPLITGERRAAEFVRNFISDHLPVIFRMNL